MNKISYSLFLFHMLPLQGMEENFPSLELK
jgi:hypothetical protein